MSVYENEFALIKLVTIVMGAQALLTVLNTVLQ